MPLLVDASNERLSDPEFNKVDTDAWQNTLIPIGKRQYSTCTYFKPTDLTAPEGYELYKKRYGREYRLIKDGITWYRDKLGKDKTVVSWWDGSQPRDSVGWVMADRVFEFILSQYRVIWSDSVQTTYSQTLWQEKVIWALSNDQYVYVVVNADNHHHSSTRIRSVEEFLLHWVDFVWGTDPERHPYRDIVISLEERSL